MCVRKYGNTSGSILFPEVTTYLALRVQYSVRKYESTKVVVLRTTFVLSMYESASVRGNILSYTARYSILPEVQLRVLYVYTCTVRVYLRRYQILRR